MKKKYLIYLIAIVLFTTIVLYLKHRHEEALINQRETPTDSDCCWEGDSCDSVIVITDSLETDSLNTE